MWGRLSMIAAVATVLVAGGCGGDDDTAETTTSTRGTASMGDDAVITYTFGDASVPPEYHRSYVLTVSKTEVHAVIDSYGDVLHDVTEPLPAEVWVRLVSTLDDVVDLEPEPDPEGCAGGTSRSVEVRDGGDTVVEHRFGVCGDVNGAVADRLDAWILPVLDAIPGWADYVAT